MNKLLYFKRRTINFIFLTLSVLAMLLGLFFLVCILLALVVYGSEGFSLSIFTHITSSPGTQGGLLNAIVGSLLMTIIAILLGAPAGLLIGVYITEFGRQNWLVKIVRFVNDLLLSAPSIIVGLFIYQIYVVNIGHFSGWAGSFALAILVLPIVIRTTEDMFSLIPQTLREAAAALGTPRWKVIIEIVLRIASTGILTGILLSFARISGETAPLLFTALSNQFWSLNMNQPMANLPMVIFQYAMSPYANWHHLAWTGALLITIWILSINIFVRLAFKQRIGVK